MRDVGTLPRQSDSRRWRERGETARARIAVAGCGDGVKVGFCCNHASSATKTTKCWCRATSTGAFACTPMCPGAGTERVCVPLSLSERHQPADPLCCWLAGCLTATCGILSEFPPASQPLFAQQLLARSALQEKRWDLQAKNALFWNSARQAKSAGVGLTDRRPAGFPTARELVARAWACRWQPNQTVRAWPAPISGPTLSALLSPGVLKRWRVGELPTSIQSLAISLRTSLAYFRSRANRLLRLESWL
ncbi:hypothetical protein L1887_47906 [Cichorium endivia]|nr:hypothetical protein L1887_47906 [Cichorium endivia]